RGTRPRGRVRRRPDHEPAFLPRGRPQVQRPGIHAPWRTRQGRGRHPGAAARPAPAMSPVRFLKKITRELSRHRRMAEAVEQMQCALARIELRQMQLLPIRPLRDAELKVFSQFGEDGILQYLLRHVPVPKRVFVEFGVSDYAESNTRFLLQNDNWSGLVIDGSRENVDFIRSQPYYWRHTLKAECAFIDRDNINGLIR